MTVSAVTETTEEGKLRFYCKIIIFCLNILVFLFYQYTGKESSLWWPKRKRWQNSTIHNYKHATAQIPRCKGSCMYRNSQMAAE